MMHLFCSPIVGIGMCVRMNIDNVLFKHLQSSFLSVAQYCFAIECMTQLA